MMFQPQHSTKQDHRPGGLQAAAAGRAVPWRGRAVQHLLLRPAACPGSTAARLPPGCASGVSAAVEHTSCLKSQLGDSALLLNTTSCPAHARMRPCRCSHDRSACDIREHLIPFSFVLLVSGV